MKTTRKQRRLRCLNCESIEMHTKIPYEECWECNECGEMRCWRLL